MLPNDREFNLISNGAVESFWDTLWLGIQAFLLFKSGVLQEHSGCQGNCRKLNLLPNEGLEASRGALWLGIRPFFFFIRLDLAFCEFWFFDFFEELKNRESEKLKS